MFFTSCWLAYNQISILECIVFSCYPIGHWSLVYSGSTVILFPSLPFFHRVGFQCDIFSTIRGLERRPWCYQLNTILKNNNCYCLFNSTIGQYPRFPGNHQSVPPPSYYVLSSHAPGFDVNSRLPRQWMWINFRIKTKHVSRLSTRHIWAELTRNKKDNFNMSNSTQFNLIQQKFTRNPCFLKSTKMYAFIANSKSGNVEVPSSWCLACCPFLVA